MVGIKGMEIPKSCSECRLNNVESPWFGLCRTTGNNVIEYKDRRHPNCPLVEIVTCKDCKHRDPEDKFCDCGHMIKWSSPREDDFYCADAERRE